MSSKIQDVKMKNICSITAPWLVMFCKFCFCLRNKFYLTEQYRNGKVFSDSIQSSKVIVIAHLARLSISKQKLGILKYPSHLRARCKCSFYRLISMLPQCLQNVNVALLPDNSKAKHTILKALRLEKTQHDHGTAFQTANLILPVVKSHLSPCSYSGKLCLSLSRPRKLYKRGGNDPILFQ